MTQSAFDFLPVNPRGEKPRSRGITEIRGPYYTPVGPHYLADLLQAFGAYVDSLKFAGGSFTLMPPAVLRELLDLAHRHDVKVSTGGFLERVLPLGHAAVDRYLRECRDLGFDTIELSAGFVSLPVDDWLRLVEHVLRFGMQPKPELAIQFGAGGDTPTAELAREQTRNARWVVSRARRFLDAGVELIMIESEGITENVQEWRIDVIAEIVEEIGLERLMFEAADPAVFAWYVKHYGTDVNLFVDHSQIIQLEALRAGIWGPQSLWGRVVAYQE